MFKRLSWQIYILILVSSLFAGTLAADTGRARLSVLAAGGLGQISGKSQLKNGLVLSFGAGLRITEMTRLVIEVTSFRTTQPVAAPGGAGASIGAGMRQLLVGLSAPVLQISRAFNIKLAASAGLNRTSLDAYRLDLGGFGFRDMPSANDYGLSYGLGLDVSASLGGALALLFRPRLRFLEGNGETIRQQLLQGGIQIDI